MNPTIQYSGYTVEIPDTLIHPFKVLATVLAAYEFDHPLDLYDNQNVANVANNCLSCVTAAIGKQYAEDNCLGDAFNHWRALGDFDRISHIIKAAMAAKPVDIGYMLETGGRKYLE
jgi:hypothetical protein